MRPKATFASDRSLNHNRYYVLVFVVVFLLLLPLYMLEIAPSSAMIGQQPIVPHLSPPSGGYYEQGHSNPISCAPR